VAGAERHCPRPARPAGGGQPARAPTPTCARRREAALAASARKAARPLSAGAGPERKYGGTPGFLSGGQLHAYQLEGLNWLCHKAAQRENVVLAGAAPAAAGPACLLAGLRLWGLLGWLLAGLRRRLLGWLLLGLRHRLLGWLPGGAQPCPPAFHPHACAAEALAPLPLTSRRHSPQHHPPTPA
jgi:hypothetical protein